MRDGQRHLRPSRVHVDSVCPAVGRWAGRRRDCVVCRRVHTGFRDEQTPASHHGPGTETRDQGVGEIRARVRSQPLRTWRRPLCASVSSFMKWGWARPALTASGALGELNEDHAQGDSGAVTCRPRESAGARPGPGLAQQGLEALRDPGAEREGPRWASDPCPRACAHRHARPGSV